jgi:6-phosphogluconolactonase
VNGTRVTVVEDEAAVAAAAARILTTLIAESIDAHPNAAVCMTGGRTAERLYALLADVRQPWRAAIDWTRVHLFWGDERHVPPDHPESNYGMAHRALVAHVPIPTTQVHRMRGELPDATRAAAEYEVELRDGFARAGRSDQRFDVMLLGLGEDAHIASIFPGSPALAETRARVAAVWAAHLNAWRITLTPSALLDARALLMIVTGTRKAEAVRVALEMPDDVSRWPVHLLRAAGDRLEWILDRAAAGSS